MMANIRLYKQEQSGVAAIEFALIAPIFIMLLLGTIDMGLFLLEQMRLQNAAHTSANYVAQATSDENAGIIAAEVYTGRGDISVDTEFSCECSDGVASICPLSCGADDYQRRFINVTVSSSYSSLFVYPGLPEDISLQGFSRMRVD